jgi:hypothetical protein
MPNRILLASIACLAAAAGCAATPAAPQAEASATVRLAVGQSADAGGGALRIVFAGVENDSRCGKGETCIWEGSATVRISVAGASGTQDVALHSSPAAGPVTISVDGWAVGLVKLEPLPIAGRSTPPADYVVTLDVRREGAAR